MKKAQAARAAGLAGVLLPPMWGSFDAYHHPKYDPFWAACQDLAMPVHFHSGPAPMEQFFGPLPPTDHDAVPPGAVGSYLMEVHVWLTRPLTFMLWGGVFTRFPKLKVAITEGTSAWVPDYLDRLEFHYAQTRESQKLGDFRAHLAESPAETFRTNVMIGSSCMSRREALQRHAIGKVEKDHQRLEQMVAIGAAADHAQAEIELCRRLENERGVHRSGQFRDGCDGIVSPSGRPLAILSSTALILSSSGLSVSARCH